jgi:hypothetical protein
MAGVLWHLTASWYVNWYWVHVVSGEVPGAQEMGSGWNLTMGMFIGFFFGQGKTLVRNLWP